MDGIFRFSRPVVRGFSLIELMVVLAIATILLGIGVPGFSLLLENQRMTTTVNEFFAAINLARSEAIRRGERVDLVPVDGKNWVNGWMVLVDENGNQEADAGEEIIFTHGAVHEGISIAASFTDKSAQYLAYSATGRTRTNASGDGMLSGSFSFASANQSRRIVVNQLGRPRSCNPATDKSTC